MVIDIDGNPVAQLEEYDPRIEWLEKVIRVLVVLFFTAQFFIAELIFLRLLFGISILEMSSITSILANIFLIMVSTVAAIFVSPLVISWLRRMS